MEDITNKIIGIILKNKRGLDSNKINPDSSFIKDLGFDSLEVVDLIIDLEDEFQITVDDQDAGNIATVKDLANKIKILVDKN
jgi:acyl carrier protein